MPKPDSRRRATPAGILGLLVTANLMLACAGIGDGRRAPVVARTPEGFTITESARPRLGLRGEFEEAREALASGNHDLAIERFVAITESDPDFAAPYINLGIAYREAGKYEEAEAALQKALELSPRHPVAHNELGIVLRRVGRFEEARKAYETALELQPGFHFARKNLAIVCDLFLSEPRCALENYGIYREAVPEDQDVAIWISDLENRFGRQGE